MSNHRKKQYNHGQIWPLHFQTPISLSQWAAWLLHCPPWRRRSASLPTSGNIKNAGMAHTRGGRRMAHTRGGRLVNLPWLMAMRRRREEARKMGNETAGTMRCYAITWERCIILFWMQEQTRTTKQQPTNSKKETWDQIPFIETISFIKIVSIYKFITKKSCCIRIKSCFIQ